MFKRLRVLAAVVPLAALILQAAEVPRKAPDFTIALPGGATAQLSQYKGKPVVLIFILTYCPHCQKTIGYLIKDQQEYGPRGLQVLACAIEQNAAAAVPGFIKQFNPPFPVGSSAPVPAIDFMQHPVMMAPHMPLLAFIDKQGNIRAQYEGNDAVFFGDQQEKNLRREIDALFNDGAPAKKSAVKKTSATRP